MNNSLAGCLVLLSLWFTLCKCEIECVNSTHTKWNNQVQGCSLGSSCYKNRGCLINPPACQENGIFAFPNECDRFYICVKGRSFVLFCRKNYVFVSATGTCELKPCVNNEVLSKESDESSSNEIKSSTTNVSNIPTTTNNNEPTTTSQSKEPIDQEKVSEESKESNSGSKEITNGGSETTIISNNESKESDEEKIKSEESNENSKETTGTTNKYIPTTKVITAPTTDCDTQQPTNGKTDGSTNYMPTTKTDNSITTTETASFFKSLFP